MTACRDVGRGDRVDGRTIGGRECRSFLDHRRRRDGRERWRSLTGSIERGRQLALPNARSVEKLGEQGRQRGAGRSTELRVEGLDGAGDDGALRFESCCGGFGT